MMMCEVFNIYFLPSCSNKACFQIHKVRSPNINLVLQRGEMHVPLDEHLHTEECNLIIRQLKRCHEETSMVNQSSVLVRFNTFDI